MEDVGALSSVGGADFVLDEPDRERLAFSPPVSGAGDLGETDVSDFWEAGVWDLRVETSVFFGAGFGVAAGAVEVEGEVALPLWGLVALVDLARFASVAFSVWTAG